jgi:hypothetical protein
MDISTDARDDPEHEALLADAVGIALQVVLDALNPAERLAFVLHDMFAVPFDEIAVLVERSPAATWQLAKEPSSGNHPSPPTASAVLAIARVVCLAVLAWRSRVGRR